MRIEKAHKIDKNENQRKFKENKNKNKIIKER